MPCRSMPKSRWPSCASWPPAPGPWWWERCLQRRDRPDPATLIGRGKVDEIAAAAKMAEANVLIFDHELSVLPAAQPGA